MLFLLSERIPTDGALLGILPEGALHGFDALRHSESLFRNLVVN